MRLETKRERALREKRRKQSSVIGLVLAFILVIALGIVLWNGKQSLASKNSEYESQIADLQDRISEQEQRRDDIEEYKKYIQTKGFIEDVAKNKFGLLYPDEVLFKGIDSE